MSWLDKILKNLNPVGLITEKVADVIDKAVDHYLPPSMSEKEKAEFKLKLREMTLKELENDVEVIKAINETMRAESKSEHWLQWSWRPLVGITFSLMVINNYVLLPYFKSYGLQPINIPPDVWSAMLVILGVAAGTRGLEKIRRGG